MWGEFQSAAGRRTTRLVISEGAAIRGVCLLVEHTTRLGKTYLLSPRGPLFDPAVPKSELAALWQSLLDGIRTECSHGVMFLKIEPNIAPPEGIGLARGTNVHPERTVFLDLRKSEDELLSSMHQKTRYNIRLAERKGVTVRFSRAAEDGEKFLELLQETAQRQGIGIFPLTYYRTMAQSLGQACEIALAEHEGIALAGAIHVRFGDAVTYLHGGSADAHHELMAPYLLHWRSALRAKNDGFGFYDFFGISPEGAVNHGWAGITRFKLGFGGMVKAYPGAYNLVYSRNWYMAYRFAKRIIGK